MVKAYVKILLVIFFTIIMGGEAYSQATETFEKIVEKNELKALQKLGVKSVTEYSFDYLPKEKVFNKEGIRYITREYNGTGGITKIIYYDIDETTMFEYIYKYKNGNLSEYSYTEPAINFSFIYKYDYNDSGKMTRSFYIERNDEGLNTYSIEYMYNSRGEPDKEITYKSDNSVNILKEYQYDHEGMLAGEILISGDGSLLMEMLNERGRPSVEIYYSSDSKISLKKTYEYGTKSELLSVSTFNGEGNLENKETLRYDNNLNLTEAVITTYSENDERGRKFTFSYSEDGLLKEQRYFDKGIPSYKITYKYEF